MLSVDGTEVSLKTLACPLLFAVDGGVFAWQYFDGDELPFGSVYIETASLLRFVKEDMEDDGLL